MMGFITFNETPRAAIIKANSPIWARLKPTCREVFKSSPAISTLKVEISAFTTNTMMVSANTVVQCSAKIWKSTIMPTDTKKIAPKRSFTLFNKLSICSASMVSERIEPITKAPNAEEKPT